METLLLPAVLLPLAFLAMVESTSSLSTSSSSYSSFSLSSAAASHVASASASTRFPAFFVFGDSLVDVGNNNYIATLARANSPPFGIDFPTGPTGRFCNGKVVVDFVADAISLPSPPPYLSPATRGEAVLQGVNYASGAAGILRRTASRLVAGVDGDTQLAWFANTVNEMQGSIGAAATQTLLRESLFFVTIGANDYITLVSRSPAPSVYAIRQYQKVLLDKFSVQLQQLYNTGARVVAVASIGPIGCIPSQLARRSMNGECSEFVNRLVLNFNTALLASIHSLNAKLPGAKFIYIDGYSPIIAVRENPQQFALKVVAEACCGAGRFKGQLACLPILVPCPNRDDYLFWDSAHPSEAANKFLAQRFHQAITKALS